MENLNNSLFDFLHGLSGKNFLVDAFVVFVASYLPYIVFIGAVLAVLFQAGWRRKLFFFAEAAIAAILSRGLITETVNLFYYSPRPFEALNFEPLISSAGGSSVPSGHAALFFALAAVIYFYNRAWGIWYFVLSVLIGVARISAGVHWPLDVIAGAIIGILSALSVRFFLRNSIKKLGEQPA